MAKNGGGSVCALLDDIFAIADDCSVDEIVRTFPPAIIDKWSRRPLIDRDKIRELSAWANESAETDETENACLLAANFSQTVAERKRWLERAFVASGTSASLSPVDEPVPFQFAKPGRFHPTENGPLITVIISAFNSADTIARAAKSILDQTCRNIELIITDDASTDQTANVIAALAQQDSRVKLRQNRENSGCYISRNTAVATAKGDFITCHDADDIAHPDKLAAQMEAFAAADAVSNLSTWFRIGRDGLVVPISFADFTQINFSSLLFRREVFDAIGYWDSVRTSADSEFRARIKRRYGQRSEQGIRPILTIGLASSVTLTGNPASEATWLRFSQARMKYRNAYMKWHKSTKPENLYMPFPLTRRPFEFVAANGNV